MAFNDFLIDTVSILKKTGEKIEGVKASVQKNKIFIPRSDILIEQDDTIERIMSNGGKETYKVIDPGFREKFGGIPAGYQMDVLRLGSLAAKESHIQQNVTYNISGDNNRINQNTTDNSINIVDTNQDLQKHIEDLKEQIQKLNLPEEEKADSLEVVCAIEEQFKSEKPSKRVVKTLLAALPNAANIATIGSLIISCL